MERATRLLALLLLLPACCSLASASAAPSPVKWIRGVYVAESPASRAVPGALLWAQAEARAAALAGVTLRGAGQSMLPLYRPGTVLVIAPVPFDQLRRGQTVVYYNRERRPVAHVLVAKCRDGWRVAGLNNRRHDDEGVTADNLFGVVAEAYHADAAAELPRLAARLD